MMPYFGKSGIPFLIILLYLRFSISQTQCQPNTCVRYFVVNKMWDIRERYLEEGRDDPIEIGRTLTLPQQSSFSSLDFQISNTTIRGLVKNLNPRTASISADVLYGRINIFLYNYDVSLTGQFTATGTALNESINTSGNFELITGYRPYTYIYFNVTQDGLVNINRNNIYVYAYDPSSISFSTPLSTQRDLDHLLQYSYGKRVAQTVSSDLGVRGWLKRFVDALAGSVNGIPLSDLTTYNVMPTAPPTVATSTRPPITTSQPIEPIYTCTPDSCINEYLEHKLKTMGEYASTSGLQEIPFNRTFTNSTVTTVFDLNVAFRDIKVSNFLTNIPTSYRTSNVLTGYLTVDMTLPAVGISGLLSGNGTVLGEPYERVGGFDGVLYLRFDVRITYNVTPDGYIDVTYLNVNRYSRQIHSFQTNMFPYLHPLREPFDELGGFQLTTFFWSWVSDLNPILQTYFSGILREAKFLDIVTGSGISTQDPTGGTTPRPTTALVPVSSTLAPYQCIPDVCLLDYVRSKLARFPDWVDSESRDPLLLPDVYTLTFPNHIWNLRMSLSNITVHGYLPTFINTQTQFTSNCLDGNVRISSYSPYLRVTGNYSSSGSLDEYSLNSTGGLTLYLRINSALQVLYTIDSQGFISGMRNIFTTWRLQSINVTFPGLVDPSAPLASLLLNDISNRAADRVAQEVGIFTPLITNFMDYLLTENKFYDIITWHRYGNETTDPPVVCSRERRSASSLQFLTKLVPVFGHVPLIIKGSRLDILQRIECMFDNDEELTVIGTVLNHTAAVCEVPYLPKTGRIQVEAVLHFHNGCDQTFRSSVYAMAPEDLRDSLNVEFINDGAEMKLQWRPGYMGTSETYLELRFVLLDIRDGKWLEQLELVVLPNNGEYILQTSELSLSDRPASVPFALYLTPDPASPLSASLYSSVLYSPDGRTKEQFSSACEEWYQSDDGPPPSSDIEPCPPLLAQAWRDNRFEYEWDLQDPLKLQYFHAGAEFVFRQVVPHVNSSHGSECAYKNGALILGPPSGGSADYSNPNSPRGFLNHHINDIRPWYLCCGYSDRCRHYYIKRPSDPGLGYVAPSPGNGEGDPHITTFDGVSYTFNGVGEFWMIKTSVVAEGSGPTIGMQARMEPFKETGDIAGQQINASVFTAFAIRQYADYIDDEDIGVEVSAITGGSLRVKVDGELLQVPEGLKRTTSIPFTINFPQGVTVQLLSASDGSIQSTILSFSGSGFSFNISTIPGHAALNILSYVNTENTGASNVYQGLLGSPDGVPNNDLTYPGEPPLHSNSSMIDIHNSFGLKWRTTADESFFVYDLGSSHSDFQDLEFTPSFEEPDIADYPEAEEICGTSKQCLYDLVSTGSSSFAQETKNFVEQVLEVEVTFEELPVMCTQILTNPENGNVDVPNYLAGSIATYSCNSGFRLQGAENTMCNSEGMWDSPEPPVCVEAATFDCTGKRDDYYPNPEDCGNYYGCLRGTVYEYTCPPPYLFHATRKFCVHPMQAVCAT